MVLYGAAAGMGVLSESLYPGGQINGLTVGKDCCMIAVYCWGGVRFDFWQDEKAG